MSPIGELSLPSPDGIHVSKRTRKKDTIEYLDMPLCFDCETFSFEVLNETGAKEKRAIMWAWGLAVGDECYMGRTWPEFVSACDSISQAWGLSPRRRAIIWVHNLSYDFSFFRKWFSWENVFPMASREMCYALTTTGIEFRCSYILTGYGLEKVGEHLAKHDIKKLVGTIDYSERRTPLTCLTDQEVSYLEHDCLVVTAHISEQIELEGCVSTIPLTKTGYVRRDVRKKCFRDDTKAPKDDHSRIRYGSFIRGLAMDEFVYDSLRRAFAGGFTHASPLHSGDVMENVSSYDFASAYPSVMCSELFPATPPQIYTPKEDEDFEKCLRLYCCVFTVTLKDVKSRFIHDHYLSLSHCDIPKGTSRQVDNGRIVWADELTTTITNVDWEIMLEGYSWTDYEVTGLIRWGRSYLPKPIVQSVITYYQKKTELKGVAGMEQEYMTAKENLNSIYGMMVMDPLRPHIPYDLETNEWGEMVDGRLLLEVALTEEEKEKALADHNTSMSRFTYYAWGVFITAYCRRNLWKGIFHFAGDYIYADTDSLKVTDGRSPEHLAYIQEHNETIQRKIKACLSWHKMDPDLSAACTPAGKQEQLGVWEYEGTYTRFKALGAKRYMVEDAGEINITVSGLNKKAAVPYILEKSKEEGKDPFDFFSEGMAIPPGHTGKMIPYYGDKEIRGKIRDRDGNIYEYYEKSYVHMEPGGYCLTLAPDYITYLDELRKGLI